VLAAAADKRSEATYDDADAVLHEAAKIQEHLAAQDKVLDALINKVQALSPSAPRLLLQLVTPEDRSWFLEIFC
jgi:hypothetical protein